MTQIHSPPFIDKHKQECFLLLRSKYFNFLPLVKLAVTRKCPTILLLNTHDSQQLRMIDLTIESDFCLQFSFQNVQKITFDFLLL